MRISECPISTTLNVIRGKWKPLLLHVLKTGPKRFSELQTLVPEATQKMLTQQLRELERDSIIRRTVVSEKLLKVEYRFTPYGETLIPTLNELCEWGKRSHADKLQTAQ